MSPDNALARTVNRCGPRLAAARAIGPDTVGDESGATPGHLFQYAASFHRDGNWIEMPEAEQYEFAEPPIVSFPHEHRDHVVDAGGLIAELRKWQART